MEPSETKPSFSSDTQSSIRDPKKQTKKPAKKKSSASSPRINSLAMPRYHSQKYEKPSSQFVQSGVSPKALTANASARIEEMSIPTLRTLVVNKQIYSRLPTTGPDYVDRLDRMIDRSWNSMYNCYKKAKTDVAEQRPQQVQVSRATNLENHSARTFKDKGTRMPRDGKTAR